MAHYSRSKKPLKEQRRAHIAVRIDLELAQLHGMTAAVLHAFLLSEDAGGKNYRNQHEISEELGLGQTAVSNHLGRLAADGLVEKSSELYWPKRRQYR